MDPRASPSPPGATIATERLLARLEAISRERPDRVLRLRGWLGVTAGDTAEASGSAAEPFELVIYRGFSSSTTHPTAFDPDQPALAEIAQLISAELLQAPLRPGEAEGLLAGPGPVASFLEPGAWR